MASESTTTTLANRYNIQKADVLLSASTRGNLEFLLRFEEIQPGSKSVRFPISTALTAAALGEASAFANSALTVTGGGTATAGNVGLTISLSPLAFKTQADGNVSLAAAEAAKALLTYREGNFFDFSSVGTTIGSTATSLTLNHVLGAIYKLENAGFLNPNKALILDPVAKQQLSVKTAGSTGTPMSVVGPRFLGNKPRQSVGELFSVPCFLSDQMTAVSTDIASGMFVYHDPQYDDGYCWKGVGEVADIDIIGPTYDHGVSQYMVTISQLFGAVEIDAACACTLLGTATAI